MQLIETERFDERVLGQGLGGEDSGRAVPEGPYRLTAELAGFQVAERQAIVVESDLAAIDFSLALASFQDSVTVSADAGPPSLLGRPQPNAPATVSRTVIDSAMLRNSRYEDCREGCRTPAWD